MNSTTKPLENGQTPPSCAVIALIVAAGNSERFGGALPKPYQEIAGKTILAHTVEKFLSHPGIDGVRVVVKREHHGLYRKAMQGITLFPLVVGGDSRQESVRLGLESLRHANPARVLVHDAARPGVSHALITRILETLDNEQAVIPTLPIADTIKHVDHDTITKTTDRTGLHAVQTPQGFDYPALLAAHEQLRGQQLTDDAALFEHLGKKVARVEGDMLNFKITTIPDMQRFMEHYSLNSETRTAMGFDVHALKPYDADTQVANQTVKICGINIPHSHYLEGHSDADVGLHAIVDAILGTIAAGDIGSHFPPDDPQWKGADSERFLLHAFELLMQKGGQIMHLDVTIIGERPKIAPHRDAMQHHIAQLLKLDKNRISIKATTTEKLGFTGRGEGIAAQAVATVKIPAKAGIQ